MSSIDLNGISAALDQLKLDLGDVYNYAIAPPKYDLPQISTPPYSSGLLSGISLSNESISKKLPYKDDIFSELPVKAFDKTYNQQMAELMSLFREEFNIRCTENKSEKIIPKLEYVQGEDEELIRMTSQWNHGNAMLYFSFEKDSKESNFGMIWNDDQKKNFSTRSGNLYLSKIEDVIHETIDFIFRVYNV